MDLAKVLAQLHQELQNLDAAIASLERIENGKRRGRGRPPKAQDSTDVDRKAATKRAKKNGKRPHQN